jgi:hypothetical protein
MMAHDVPAHTSAVIITNTGDDVQQPQAKHA